MIASFNNNLIIIFFYQTNTIKQYNLQYLPPGAKSAHPSQNTSLSLLIRIYTVLWIRRCCNAIIWISTSLSYYCLLRNFAPIKNEQNRNFIWVFIFNELLTLRQGLKKKKMYISKYTYYTVKILLVSFKIIILLCNN